LIELNEHTACTCKLFAVVNEQYSVQNECFVLHNRTVFRWYTVSDI